MEGALQLPIIDLSSTDQTLLTDLLRKACIENRFFYLINHGVEEDLIQRVFEGSRKFFALSLAEKMKMIRKNHRGYTPFYDEKLNLVDNPKGDPKESIYFGAPEDISPYSNLNQWPPEEVLPCWRSTMEEYYRVILNLGKRVLSLIALALNVNEDFFEKVGAFNPPGALLRPIHYPVAGEIDYSDDQHMHGCGAHTDYGMITILMTDGLPGLQVCRDKLQQPQIWEDVPQLNRGFIVNIGDMIERWTNCLFRSIYHRVTKPEQERYSVAMFFDPSPDCVVECLKSCCSESSPPTFPPVRVADYLKETYNLTYGYQCKFVLL
ncbi:2-oxoglutarate-Fe(II) type oxidoreductase hxnY-like isoform X1 [Lycium barbarum]|uniref:2-oxoglutarate-Fe(II) type oxidoreductase hxnY-like isoform X1 n=2 Tax=Lycium barbarum TaxID=112863 RepID=UPI00293E3C02|nr:2-oxoglutarate-Fe(II) type oxidoreductase hxnY-like isoform X1 [Lycium barbarum]